MAKKNFYVVWEGLKPGIYKTWDECKAMTQGYPGAKFMGFATLPEAQQAYHDGKSATKPVSTVSAERKSSPVAANSSIIANSLAVDAACSGNPGIMEYRGVHVATGEEWFHKKYDLGTNNIGEFLAIVHGLAELNRRQLNIPIYTDSMTALSWLRRKKCNSKLDVTPDTKVLFDVIARAENWLAVNTWQQPVLKWDTDKWGEIPADFGRK